MRLAAGSALAIAAMLAAASPGGARAEYPYAGSMTVAADPAAPSAADALRCALNFLVQEKSGRFTSYHVDLPEYDASRTIRYLVYQRGMCVYDGKRRLETCNMMFDTNPVSQGRIYASVIRAVGATFVETMAFESVAQAEDFAETGETEEGFPVSYFLCPFDRAKLAAALSSDISRLPIAQRDRLLEPDPAMLQTSETRALAAAMGLQP